MNKNEKTHVCGCNDCDCGEKNENNIDLCSIVRATVAELGCGLDKMRGGGECDDA